MPKQLIYEGCKGKDAALITWDEQVPGSPTSCKTTFTPIKIYKNPPGQGGELNVYEYYELHFVYSIVDYHIVNGIPTPITLYTDLDGNTLEQTRYVYGAPSNLREVFERTSPEGTDVYIWTITVDGMNYEYVYNETTEQYEQVDIPYQYEEGLIQTYSQPLPRGGTYGEVEILDIYVIDSLGNQIPLSGSTGSQAWELIVEGTVADAFEEVFKQTFVSEPTGIYVDCDRCPNKCLQVYSNDKKRFACICNEAQ
ncbi:MAG: hypothetical protein KME43_25385 [Myxacorys chilensis ATA2-1-KO14]|jgi:hypothetical protein|nr:hypothetical protein [Myxacorys chilensis ATA2-1-KO14]